MATEKRGTPYPRQREVLQELHRLLGEAHAYALMNGDVPGTVAASHDIYRLRNDLYLRLRSLPQSNE